MKTPHLKTFKLSSIKTLTAILLVGFGAGYGLRNFSDSNPSSTKAPNTPISVCFTPNKQCQSQILSEINKAKKSIRVQAYSFTDKDIGLALVEAKKRGVDVQVILDKSNIHDKHSLKTLMMQNRIPVRFDHLSGIAHNKNLLLDQETIVTGSYNFSTAAYSRNAENLLIIRNLDLAQHYLQNWQSRWKVSRKLAKEPY